MIDITSVVIIVNSSSICYSRYRSLDRNVLMFDRSSTALTSCLSRWYCCSPFPPSCVRFSSCAIWYSTISAYVNAWARINGPAFEKSLLVRCASNPSRKRLRSPCLCLGYVSCWSGLRKAWRKSVRSEDQLLRTIGEYSEFEAYNRIQCHTAHRLNTASLKSFRRMISKSLQSIWEWHKIASNSSHSTWQQKPSWQGWAQQASSSFTQDTLESCSAYRRTLSEHLSATNEQLDRAHVIASRSTGFQAHLSESRCPQMSEERVELLAWLTYQGA